MDQWLSNTPSKSSLDSATQNRTAYQLALDTDEQIFQNASHRDEGRALQRMSAYMQCLADTVLTWYNVFPVEEQAADMTPDQVLWVDVGAGVGNRTQESRAKLPKLPGQVFIQDVSSLVAAIPAQLGVELMSHDCLSEQPVKGAKFYHLRYVLHDWVDDECVRILSRLKDAMAANSIVLIEETLVPDMNAHYLASTFDLTMMCVFGFRERTIPEFREIAKKAELELVSAATHKPTTGMGVTALWRANPSGGQAS